MLRAVQRATSAAVALYGDSQTFYFFTKLLFYTTFPFTHPSLIQQRRVYSVTVRTLC